MLTGCCNARKRIKSRRLSYLSLVIAACSLFLYINYTYKYGRHRQANEELSSGQQLALTSDKESCTNVCSNKACVMAGANFLETMEPSVDPCVDSYAFACANYEWYTPEEDLKDDRVYIRQLLLNMKDTIDGIDDFLGSPAENLKTFYDSCMDSKSSQFVSTDTLSEYLEQFGMGEWPNLRRDFRFERKYESLAAYFSYTDPFRGDNSNPLMILGAVQDPSIFMDLISLSHNPPVLSFSNTSSEIQRLAIYPGHLMTSNEEIEPIAVKFLSYLGARTSHIRTILADYNKMENAMKINTETFQVPNPELLDCKTQNMPFVCDTLKKFVDYNDLERSHSKWEAVVYNMPLMMEVSKLVSDVSDKTLANYLALRFVLHNRHDVDLITDRLSILHFKRYEPAPLMWFDQLFLGRWRQCLALPGVAFKPVLTTEYVKQKISKEALRMARQMIDFHIGIISYHLKKQTWLPEKRRKEFSDVVEGTIDRLDLIVRERLNSTSIAVFYDGLNLRRQSYLQNSLEVKRHFNRKNMIHPFFSALGDIFHGDNPFQQNAKFLSHMGIEVQFGLFLPPVFDLGRPKLLNFATMGDIIAHEMGHVINALFCPNFLACESDQHHLDNVTKINFQAKKECLVKQYSQFYFEAIKKNLDGEHSFSENFGDLVAAELTPKMIEMYLDEAGDSAKFSLPGLPQHDFMQLLYVSVNKFQCENVPLRIQLKYADDVHPPTNIRIQAKAQNSKKYADVFHCPADSKLNPVHKCTFFEGL